MNIKTLVIIILLISGCSPKAYYNLEAIKSNEACEMNVHAIDLAKEVLLNDCRKDKGRIKRWWGARKQYGIYDVDNLEFVSMPLFEVGKMDGNYSSNIVQHLKWNGKDLFGFYTFKKGEFEGLLDWSHFHHGNHKTECWYFTVHNDNMIGDNPIWLGYKFLKKQNRNTDCLFGVKYFLSTLWFVEDKEVFVLDLKEMKVYNPDEFIQSKCDEGFVDVIANGSRVRCNH